MPVHIRCTSPVLEIKRKQKKIMTIQMDRKEIKLKLNLILERFN